MSENRKNHTFNFIQLSFKMINKFSLCIIFIYIFIIFIYYYSSLFGVKLFYFFINSK